MSEWEVLLHRGSARKLASPLPIRLPLLTELGCGVPLPIRAMAGNVRFSTVSATESPTARTARTVEGLRQESQHRETVGRQSGAERGDVAEATCERWTIRFLIFLRCWAREYETASRNTGQEAEVEDAAEMPEYEANNVRFTIVSDRAELARLEEDLKQNGYEVRYRAMVKVSDEAAEEDYDAGPATFEESVTGGLLKAASRTSAALSARVAAMRALGGN